MISWGDSHQYDKGITPSVALTEDGMVVEVHETNSRFSSNLFYHIGKIDTTNKLIKWGPSYRYGEGKYPSVAMNKQGTVVEMHVSQGVQPVLWYHVGKLPVDGKDIIWGTSEKTREGGELGLSPSVAIDNSNQVIEVHKSEGLLRNLWCHVGKADPERQTITWLDEESCKYDRGMTPSISIASSGGAMVEVHETDNQFKNALWYHTGNVMNN